MIRERLQIWLFIAVLTVCGARPLVALPLQRTTSFASCSSNEDNTTKYNEQELEILLEDESKTIFVYDV